MAKLFILSVFLPTLTLISANAQYTTNCVTPNNAPGTCIEIRSCEPLMNQLLATPLQPASVDFLRRSRCGSEGNYPRVCCPIQSQPNSRPIPSTEEPITDQTSNPLLPTDCGKDLSQRIIGGKKTELDDFPWMALLEYAGPGGKRLLCGGSLISRRYVLTAAHCVKNLRPESVRLGEYNTATNPDCIADGGNDVVCADEPISVGIDEQIIHENYRQLLTDPKYDVALLRLSRDVQFTNYIQAICLPSRVDFGQSVVVAGWGTTENSSSSDVKLKVSLSMADREQCRTTYREAGVSIGYGQMCVGGEAGKDSCRGDSGGPLMCREKFQDGTGRWSVVGVVSFGLPGTCGKAGVPGIYTRVTDFVPWILSKMRP